MIIVTGANGFIGSVLLHRLAALGHGPLVAVDVYPELQVCGGQSSAPPTNARYHEGLALHAFVDREHLPQFLLRAGSAVQGIYHLGACSDTTVTDRDYVMRVNYEYTCSLWQFAFLHQVPLVYASSAATYGDGAQGYDDQINPQRYVPLNLYGQSKQRFDLWALEQDDAPPRWAGLKFFNVYGPHEAHKDRMASVALHAWQQIHDSGRVALFQSHRPDVADGGQQRDFVFVLDAVDATIHLMQAPVSDAAPNGLYNVGTGIARSFADLAHAVFKAMNRPAQIDYIPMPEDLRGRYQYFTQARIDKLRASGYRQPMHTLEAGVAAYVQFLEAQSASPLEF